MLNKKKRDYSRFDKKKKVFTIDNIKDNIDFSIFLTRLFYVGYSLDYVCMISHKMKQSDINTFVSRLKELGLITIINITKANENLIECLNKQHPNYYKNVDFKTDVIYLRTNTLFENKNLIFDIKDKWNDNEYYNSAYLQIENEYITTQYLNKKLKQVNSFEGKRSKSFPDGTTIQIDTTKQKLLNVIAKQEVKFIVNKEKNLLIENHKGTEITLKQTNTMLQLEQRDLNEKLREVARRDNIEKLAKEEFKSINKFNSEQDKQLEKLSENNNNVYNLNKKEIKEINNRVDVDSFSDILDHVAPDTINIKASHLINQSVKKVWSDRELKDRNYLLRQMKQGNKDQQKKARKMFEKNYGAVEE